MKKFKYIIVNSTILFVCAAILQMTLHEFGHFAAAIFLHAKNVVLHHNYVLAETTNMPTSHAVIYAAAGPFVSLFIGMFFNFVCRKQKSRNMVFLFNLYMSIFGYIAFFGYLMTAPFFIYGDIGYILNALNFHIAYTVSIAVVGVIALYFIMRKLVVFFIEMGTDDIVEDKKARRTFMQALVQYPLYIGIIITTLLNLPVPTILSVIYPICSPFSIMWVYGEALSAPVPPDKINTEISTINRIKPLWIVFFFLIVLINRLLVYGIT